MRGRMQVQAHRAELYTQLSTGFRDFLGHGQEAVLAPLMQQITPGFVAVSKQVRGWLAQLVLNPFRVLSS